MLLGGLPAMVELLAPNTALVPRGFELSNAMVRRLGLDDPGVMPVTVPVVEVTPVTAVPVAGLRVAPVKNDPEVVVVFTPVRALPNVGTNPVNAVPVCPLTPFTTLVDVVLRLAPVRNDPGVVCTPVTALENVGVTADTTVVPGAPLTPLTTLAKVAVTPVTHVAAEAEDNSPALRLPTVSAARSVWFEADANSANTTAARRGTIVCFGLAIRRPHESGLALSIAEKVWQNFAKRADYDRAFGRICCGCCKGATIRV
jgi:hypothetical protein